MRRLEGRENAFFPAEALKCGQRRSVIHPGVLGASAFAQPRMLGSDGRIVESGGNGMRQLDVAVRVLEHETPRALEHSGASAREPCRVLSRRDTAPARFDADQTHLVVRDE